MKLQGNLVGMTGWSDGAGGIASKLTRYNALLEITQCRDKNMLRQKIKEMLYKHGIIEIGNDKQNVFILKTLSANLKDESRAYNAGGYVEKLYRQSTQKTAQIGTTKSEVIADIYDEAIKVMKKERMHIRWNRLKEFFGFKADRSIEQEILNSTIQQVNTENRAVKVKVSLIKIKELLDQNEIKENDLKTLLKDIEN